MTLKEIINNDIYSDEITSIVGDKIYYLQKLDNTDNDIYVEWRFISKEDSEYAGDKALCNEALIQIDIFSNLQNLNRYEELIEVISKVFINKDYDYYDEEELYEDDTELLHFGYRFSKKIFKKEG